MRMLSVILLRYRSVHYLEFDLGPFTVLFGKNNAGKTNLLEAIYGVLAPEHMPTFKARELSRPVPGLRGSDDYLPPMGAVHAQLEQGLAFDDAVLRAIPEAVATPDRILGFRALPQGHVWFANLSQAGLWFVDVRDHFIAAHAEVEVEEDFQSLRVVGPRPRPLFLGWDVEDVETLATSAIAKLTAVPGEFDSQPLVLVEDYYNTWRVRTEIWERLDQLAALATDLLPDFIDGSIQADFYVPTGWDGSPRLWLYYQERGGSERLWLEDFGKGSSRWMAVAVQVALRIMEEDPHIKGLVGAAAKQFSGHVLFVDEPEAHLHPSAVASVVRWCQRMVSCGFSLVAASHHEEFLRASGDEVKFVKVSRGLETSHTNARTLLSTATPLLQELATEVGMHPAAALSLHRAILFVEGPLDEAILDEYAGPALDAAGVTIIPLHGTKNLEGLIQGEFTARLGIKTGVLTDKTVAATMWDRSGKKRSGEEKKLIRLIKRFEDQGLVPPEVFGIAEDDMLFALPTQAIREYLQGPFPGWDELREECREAEGLGPSDSVDWKSYAETKYGLPITTTSGVRDVVRKLDLAGVELQSLRTVADEIIAWVKAPGDLA
jgi:energy-coupling factor transporter ATP-binding protein EcfA2